MWHTRPCKAGHARLAVACGARSLAGLGPAESPTDSIAAARSALAAIECALREQGLAAQATGSLCLGLARSGGPWLQVDFSFPWVHVIRVNK